jgi:hypothetical protein
MFAAAPLSAAESPDLGEGISGPFWSGTIDGLGPGDAIAVKGIAVILGTNRNAYVCYDTDLMRLSLAWTGGFLQFGNTRTSIEWPPPPRVKGTPIFRTFPKPGWAVGDDLSDPRTNHQGPLPRDRVHYRGLYVNGDRIAISFTVGNCDILESPGVENTSAGYIFTRTFQIGKSITPLTLLVADMGGSSGTNRQSGPAPGNVVVLGDNTVTNGYVIAAAVRNAPNGSLWETADGALLLKLPALPAGASFQLAIWGGDRPSVTKVGPQLNSRMQPVDFIALRRGGVARFPDPVVTRGSKGSGAAPYLVDTLTEPATNPWNARMFFGGFDFFPDSRAAIGTFHGDVWIVSGIDDSLERLEWRRFATGLFQPLGLKIVDDRIYVLGRDQITRLHDLNHDGEADFYENFNNDAVVTSNYHEFALDLDTDSQGNFYYARGAPWEPDVTSPHQGCLLKVSKDGSRLEVVATGFRAPNGLAVGPRDEITVSDNQGHWMPSSKLDLIRPGGFYGMTPAAHRELTLKRADGSTFLANPSDPGARERFRFRGWDKGAPIPENCDPPLVWLPMSVDNSSGGQVWVTGDKWGPFKDSLLFMSYGKCTLFHVMQEQVDGVMQGAVVQLPVKFNSGIMRGRINPRDGQVYVCGLKGWQTSAVRDGGFYRVRYTGKQVRMASSIHFLTDGVEIEFTTSLDPKSAGDVQNYSVEQWNYLWTGEYGSPDVSVRNPSVKKHDPLEIKSARLLKDGRTVVLEIPDLRPADQIKIRLYLDSADGEIVSQDIHGTIHKLGPAMKPDAN